MLSVLITPCFDSALSFFEVRGLQFPQGPVNAGDCDGENQTGSRDTGTSMVMKLTLEDSVKKGSVEFGYKSESG
jgi:hypothetical protein